MGGEAVNNEMGNDRKPQPGQNAGMPKWLIYGFAIKMVIAVGIVLGVMYAAGVFG